MKDNIVFLHGITGDRNAFKTEYEYLKSAYDCWWYDFPGYGFDTLGKDVPFSLEILVEQLNSGYTNQSWLKQYAMLQNPNRKEIPEDSQSIFYKYGQLLHPNVFEKAVCLVQ
ncbi:alpha/beta fold hydrolase [Bacillus thuringiensis]|uniref:alpha/beta fold hydrolase n=1 Tax=Bacillus thuringiensis TaxID=1428 RepID=UPI003F6B46B6